MTVFEGSKGVTLYRAMAIRAGLQLYMKTKLQPNSLWTPSAMLRAAESICGTRYKHGEYASAVLDLTAWIEKHKGVS